MRPPHYICRLRDVGRAGRLTDLMTSRRFKGRTGHRAEAGLSAHCRKHEHTGCWKLDCICPCHRRGGK